MNLRLIQIDEQGEPAEPLDLSEFVRATCNETAAMYRRSGFVPPWIAYLAQEAGELVGTCAFKSAPRQGRVEIAYFTFPPFAGRGVATEMARQLIAMAANHDATIRVIAQTLPEEGPSTAVLRKLGFELAGTVNHPEDGEVWEWWQRCG